MSKRAQHEFLYDLARALGHQDVRFSCTIGDLQALVAARVAQLNPGVCETPREFRYLDEVERSHTVPSEIRKRCGASGWTQERRERMSVLAKRLHARPQGWGNGGRA